MTESPEQEKKMCNLMRVLETLQEQAEIRQSRVTENLRVLRVQAQAGTYKEKGPAPLWSMPLKSQ